MDRKSRFIHFTKRVQGTIVVVIRSIFSIYRMILPWRPLTEDDVA